ncbi:hypothetical protein B0E38_07827 [Streptomyces sp. 111WW2]|nr:hypothetical protein B0E38_07827 [Streptomyces sp. 111WW2]
MQEAALADVRGTGLLRVRVVQVLQVPAPVDGELGDGVHTVRHQPPQLLGRGHPARVAAGHADDRDRLVGRAAPPGRRRCVGRPQALGDPGEQMGRHGPRRRMVEDHRRGQPQTRGGTEAVAQVNTGHRVEADVVESAFGVDGGAARVAEDRGDGVSDQAQDRVAALVLGQCRDPARPVRSGTPGARTGLHGAAGTGAHQSAQERGQRLGAGTEAGQVQRHRYQQRLGARQRGVEQGQALLRGERGHSGAGPAGEVGLAEGAAHAVRGVPQPPGERGRGQPGGAAVRGQGVQIGVGRGVVGLARGAGDAGDRGEQYEGRQVEVLRQLVQMPGRVDLGAQHRGELLRCERLRGRVVEDARGVHHRRQRVPGVDGG